MNADNTRFIIALPDGGYLCPVCGFEGAFYGDHFSAKGGVIGTGICPCCLFEPGFDDDPGASRDAKATVEASIRSYREAWTDAGAPWREGGGPPPNWNAARQLEQLFETAPFLAGS